MNKLLTAFVAALFLSSVATADVPPPPPPKGYKYVSVASEAVLAKDVTGYVFVTQVIVYQPAPAKPKYAKVELTADKPVAMPAAGRRTAVALVAIPQDAAKEFKTDDDLFAALEGKKVKGAFTIGFPGTATVMDSVKDDNVKWTYTITAIEKDGIKTKTTGEGTDKILEKKKGKEPMGLGSSWMAGGAATLAVMLGGLWLVGRTRRKA